MDKTPLILVVDDNSECRKLLEWILELHGFQTISAACGLDAIQLAIEFQPSLILMDISMPDIDGQQAAQAIHTHRRGRKIPIVAVSADVDYMHASRDFKTSFVAWLEKPWQGEDLLHVVTKILDWEVKPHACLQHRDVANV